MITNLQIQGFKSIERTEIELGLVNVFIGANGSGKSNLLEAAGVLAAAASGRVDIESLLRRGCRPGGFFTPLFHGGDLDAEVEISAKGEQASYSVSLAPPKTATHTWEFRKEIWTAGDAKLLDRHSTDKALSGDPQGGLAALRLAETPVNSPGSVFLKALASYNIYEPDIPVLRGALLDPQLREPLGLSGGRLAEAIAEVENDPDRISKLGELLRSSIPWFSDMSVTTVGKGESAKPYLGFLDRYMRSDNNNFYWLGTQAINEGLLYVLFAVVLSLHPEVPRFFAIENGDNGMNPLLAKRLLQAMCGWILEEKNPRQILMTAQNPLVLDGLPLRDERVRLFTVDRDNRGTTCVTRFMLTDEHLKIAKDHDWPLSRMWVNGLIGGVPDV